MTPTADRPQMLVEEFFTALSLRSIPNGGSGSAGIGRAGSVRTARLLPRGTSSGKASGPTRTVC
jgi:hypothetical protein